MSFQSCINHILEAEGGFVDHDADRGGPTNFGVTLATLLVYRKRQVTSDDVKNMTRAEAIKIYQALYWDPMALSAVVDSKVALILFDQGVNRGPEAAIVMLQQALVHLGQAVDVDGVLGPETSAAVNKVAQGQLAVDLIKASQRFYIDLAIRKPTQLVFLKGWLARTWRLLDMLA